MSGVKVMAQACLQSWGGFGSIHTLPKPPKICHFFYPTYVHSFLTVLQQFKIYKDDIKFFV